MGSKKRSSNPVEEEEEEEEEEDQAELTHNAVSKTLNKKIKKDGIKMMGWWMELLPLHLFLAPLNPWRDKRKGKHWTKRHGCFSDLTSADASVRGVAVERLVGELQEVQKAYDRLDNKALVEDGAKLEAEKDGGLTNCAPSLRYAVRRLIRRISSSRECARQGFALGLTILVRTIPSIKVDSLLKLIVNLLEVSSSMKGQEARDCLLGCLFAYGALAQSDRLTEEWAADKSLHTLRNLSVPYLHHCEKQYLQEPAVSVILELVEKLPADALLSQS
ncbi:hypothetical protein SLA2020_256140 [Shorea laevis]